VDHAPGAPRYEGLLNPADYQPQVPKMMQPAPQHKDQYTDQVAITPFLSYDFVVAYTYPPYLATDKFIWAVVIVWRIRVKIIGTAQCCIVYHNCTYEQFLQVY